MQSLHVFCFSFFPTYWKREQASPGSRWNLLCVFFALIFNIYLIKVTKVVLAITDPLPFARSELWARLWAVADTRAAVNDDGLLWFDHQGQWDLESYGTELLDNLPSQQTSHRPMSLDPNTGILIFQGNEMKQWHHLEQFDNICWESFHRYINQCTNCRRPRW